MKRKEGPKRKKVRIPRFLALSQDGQEEKGKKARTGQRLWISTEEDEDPHSREQAAVVEKKKSAKETGTGKMRKAVSKAGGGTREL